jgi:hypothetical protein
LSLAAGAQPDVFAEFLAGGPRNGLTERPMVAFPNPVAAPTREIDYGRREEQLAALARRLHGLGTRVIVDPDMAHPVTGLRRLRLCLADGKRFLDWRDAHMADLRWRHGMSVPGYLAKAPGHVLRVAMALHLLEWAQGDDEMPSMDVPDKTLEAAIAFVVDYTHPHQERARLDTHEPDGERLGRVLASWLVESGTEAIDVVDLRRGARLPGLRTADAIKIALQELQDCAWLAPGTDLGGKWDPLPSVVSIRPGLIRYARERLGL